LTSQQPEPCLFVLSRNCRAWGYMAQMGRFLSRSLSSSTHSLIPGQAPEGNREHTAPNMAVLGSYLEPGIRSQTARSPQDAPPPLRMDLSIFSIKAVGS